MKLSTILRAIVRPYVDSVVQIANWDDTILINIFGDRGLGFGMTTARSLVWRPRARVHRIGDLEVAYWGRDTLVHPAPEAS